LVFCSFCRLVVKYQQTTQPVEKPNCRGLRDANFLFRWQKWCETAPYGSNMRRFSVPQSSTKDFFNRLHRLWGTMLLQTLAAG